jgi:hypothetical protein
MAKELTDRVWMRSREEEKGPARLYRPREHPFPPARGREGLSFCSDGTFKYLTPGRNDIPVGAAGHWHGDPCDPTLIIADIDGTTIRLHIIEVTDDRLCLEWLCP